MTDLATLTSGSGQPGGSGGRDGRVVVARRLLILATLVTVALWWVPYSNVVLYPIRLFVTFVHESGHALASVTTGGAVDWMRINRDGSGVTETQGGIAFIIISAGYLGSTIFGALLLQVGRLSRAANWGRATLVALAACVLTVTLLWAHRPFSDWFTPAAGIALTIILVLLARIASPRVAAFIVSFLAVQCCLNAVTDQITLYVITSQHMGDNDAVFMQRAYPYGPPALFWCIAWMAISLVVLGFSLRSLFRSQPGTHRKTAAE